MASKYGAVEEGEPRLLRGAIGISPWRGIMKFNEDFREGLSWLFGNGQRTSFWEDKWCGSIPLKQVYPTIFSLVANPRAMVADYLDLSHGRPIWQPNLRRPAFDWEIADIASLLDQIGGFQVDMSSSEMRIWATSSNGSFSVKCCADWLNTVVGLHIPWKHIWVSSSPLKVQFFMWIATLGKISIVDRLLRKGMYLPNVCSLCYQDGESIAHVLLHCPFSWEIWCRVIRDFGLLWVSPQTCQVCFWDGGLRP